MEGGVEFKNLDQGTMTITEYEAKFTGLDRVALDLNATRKYVS